MKLTNSKFILIILVLLPSLAQGYVISAGTYVPYFNQAQVSDSGETQKFEINPYFGAGTQYALSGPHYFLPEIGFSYFLQNSKNTKKDVIFLHYNFGYTLNSQFIIRYGLTNHWYRLHGQGGSVSLSNGNGKTTFPSPDKTVVTYFTTLNIGGEYMFPSRQFSARYDFNIMSFQELDNRAYNYILTFNWYL
ncbi:MAG: hypothetical protein ACJAS4_001040 [Bacteriovoracaceae bacterium]|jgi:hypothetical protein